MALHVLLAVAVRLLDDARRFGMADTEAAGGAGDERRGGRVAEDVQRVGAVGEHALRAPADEHDVVARRRLLDHAARHLHEAVLGEVGDLVLAGDEHLRRGEGERGRQPLDQRGEPLLARFHLLVRDAELVGDRVDQLVVEDLPAERRRDAGGDLGAAGAVHPRDRDDGHRSASRPDRPARRRPVVEHLVEHAEAHVLHHREA